jgi:putative transposase
LSRRTRGWAGDITDSDTDEGWLSLAVVLDLFSRQGIGWAMAGDRRQELVMDAFQRAWFRRGLTRPAGLLFPSDRGSQEAGEAFQKMLRQYQVQPSMSRKGNCGDHACSETLFGSLKVERWHGQRLETRQQARDEVLDGLPWYHRKRRPSTLNYLARGRTNESGSSGQPRRRVNKPGPAKRRWKRGKAQTAFHFPTAPATRYLC